MKKHIMVPTDFSETAAKALEFAVRSTEFLPAKITLIHSHEVSDNLMTGYVGVDKEFSMSLLNEAAEKLGDIQREIKQKYGVEIKTEISGKSLGNALKGAIKNEGVDLIVMGTLGAGGTGNKIWGSTTSAIIGKTKVPVMAVPSNYQWTKPEKILFATNRFERETGVLDYIFEMADLYMSQVRTAVFTDSDSDKAETFVKHDTKLKDYEAFLKDEYREDTLSARHLLGDDFEETIQEYISEKDVDILIMVTYQGGFWSRFFNPSKTKKMSYTTKIPLLAIPAGYER